MPRVLVSDPIAPEGIEILKRVADVDVKTNLPKEELIAIIGDYDALAVRSETKVTADVLAQAKNLKIIGRAGVGVDNIDVAVATERGILVVNSPEGNTLAAAELTVAMLLASARSIPQADQSLRGGKWDRKKFMGSEVYGKTLGVIGLGKIGREVAKRLQSFGMTVVGYDPYLQPEQAEAMGIKLLDLDTLYKESDYITVHVPKTKETTGMIDAAKIALMKPTVRLINVARPSTCSPSSRPPPITRCWASPTSSPHPISAQAPKRPRSTSPSTSPSRSSMCWKAGPPAPPSICRPSPPTCWPASSRTCC
jgi:D-3-phosphoglycerate dehydrogenase